MIYWLYSRPLDTTVRWLESKFVKKPEIAAANVAVMKAGYNYCDITQAFQVRYEVEAAHLPAGTYRNIMGNSALSLGLVAASRRSRNMSRSGCTTSRWVITSGRQPST
jgi:2-oxoglutarate ferredoxin oxidoreductase subunit alpha